MTDSLTKSEVASFFTPASKMDFSRTKMNILDQPSSHIKKITFDGNLTMSFDDGTNNNNLSNSFHNDSSDADDGLKFRIKMPPLPSQLEPSYISPGRTKSSRRSILNKVMRRLSVSRSNLNSIKNNNISNSISNQTISSGKSENSVLSSRPSLLKRFMSIRKKDVKQESSDKPTRWNSEDIPNTSNQSSTLSYSKGCDELPPNMKSFVPIIKENSSKRFIDKENAVSGTYPLSSFSSVSSSNNKNSSCEISPLSLSEKTPIIESRISNYKPSYLNLSIAAYGYHRNAYTGLVADNFRSSSVPPKSDSKDCYERTTDSLSTSGLLLNSALLEPPPWRRPQSYQKKFIPTSPSSKNHTENISYPETKPLHNSVETKLISPKIDEILPSVNDTRRVTIEDPSSTKPITIELRSSRNRTKSSNMSNDSYIELDQWQRNSLIMLSVAKSSPRAKDPLKRAESPTNSVPQTPSSDLMSASAHGDILHTRETTPPLSVDDKPLEPIINGFTNTKSKVPPLPEATVLPIHDGHYFLHVVDLTETEIEQTLEKIEISMAENKDVIHEEVLGSLCTTIGMARLLIREKFRQFRGLCQLNIEHHAGVGPNPTEMAENPEKFASGDDLAGFWAMVNLQVENVRKMFAEVDRFRENNWQPIAPRRHSVASPLRISRPSRRPLQKPNVPQLKEDVNSASEEKNAALQEKKRIAKERLMKAKQDMLAKKQLNQQNHEHESNGFMVI